MKYLLSILLLLLICFKAESSVTLAWDASPDTNVSGYYLCYGLQSGQYTYTNTLPGPITNNVVTGLETGKVYYFAVAAYSADGLMSDFSNEVTYTNNPPIGPSSVTYLVAKVEWWTNMMYITRSNFNLTSFTNPPTLQFYRSSLIITNQGNNVVALKTKLEWWTNLVYMNKQIIDLQLFTNAPNPQFYRSFLIITNKPF